MKRHGKEYARKQKVFLVKVKERPKKREQKKRKMSTRKGTRKKE